MSNQPNPQPSLKNEYNMEQFKREWSQKSIELWSVIPSFTKYSFIDQINFIPQISDFSEVLSLVHQHLHRISELVASE